MGTSDMKILNILTYITHNVHSDIYFTTTTNKIVDVRSALWVKLDNKSIRTVKMDDTFSSLKLKLYLFASADSEQWQDQGQLPA